MAKFIDYEEINIINDTRESAIALYDGGWASADRDQMLNEYFGDVYREDFDFEEWQFKHPDSDIGTLDELKEAIEESIDGIIGIIGELEKDN